MFTIASRRILNAGTHSCANNEISSFISLRCMSSLPSTMKVRIILSNNMVACGRNLIATTQRAATRIHTCDRAPPTLAAHAQSQLEL
ncbi:hypothetical protein HJC23_011539 [Cyclotella cryptica]|uniref:Uncharacterized protein n=1 Tax=Cyclotella cryptica TaxID=29204 RepID=A0ABD3PUI1_9STRA